MSINREMIIKRGEAITYPVTIKDRAGVTPDLTGFTITMYATAHGSKIHVADAVITLLNQITDQGKFTAKWSTTATNNPAGTYDLECKIINVAGDPAFIPRIKGVPFGKFIIVESKA